MSKPRATEDSLGLLHEALCKNFTEVLTKGVPELDPETGEIVRKPITAAYIAQIRQFLKDNKIEALPETGSPLGHLVGVLPSFDDDDVHLRH